MGCYVSKREDWTLCCYKGIICFSFVSLGVHKIDPVKSHLRVLSIRAGERQQKAVVAEISASASICNRRRSYNIGELVVVQESAVLY